MDTELERYGNRNCLLQMNVSPQASEKNPAQLVRAMTYELDGKQETVLTSLPVERFSAAQVTTLYYERWEIELRFRDTKSSMQHNALTQRSKIVELVYPEL